MRTAIEIYEKAKEKWGFVGQRIVLIEECSELSAAMAQFINGKRKADSVVEELADVEIMCAQMRLYFSGEEIDRVKKLKLERLEKLLFETK